EAFELGQKGTKASAWEQPSSNEGNGSVPTRPLTRKSPIITACKMRGVECALGPRRPMASSGVRQAKWFLAVVVLATALAVAAKGRAETPGGRAASVALLLSSQQDLRDWVLANHRDVSAASARVEQARADHGASRILLPNPVVDF